MSRRRLLELGLVLPPLAAIAGQADLFDTGVALAATPELADADDPTPALTEGPYFTPESPRRKSIVPAGAGGTRLTLTGRVLSTAGRPVANALIDWWQSIRAAPTTTAATASAATSSPMRKGSTRS